MSNVFDAIRMRRSIRKYQTRPIQQELIKEVLVAAGWAPSAHNAQPWRFIVLENILVKRKLAEAMAESWATDMAKDGLKIEADMYKVRVERFATAPLIILACLTMDGMNKFSDQERQNTERDLAMQSLGAALQNILLVAYEKGLGACWFCAPGFCKQTVRKVLRIPDEVVPEALIAMGYPAEEPTAPPRKVLSEYGFKDKWGKKLN
jgi:coenzyme F420-0:L-glutamate ligase/coenzyme F420-1:gamma-L-glutamate ligase